MPQGLRKQCSIDCNCLHNINYGSYCKQRFQRTFFRCDFSTLQLKLLLLSWTKQLTLIDWVPLNNTVWFNFTYKCVNIIHIIHLWCISWAVYNVSVFCLCVIYQHKIEHNCKVKWKLGIIFKAFQVSSFHERKLLRKLTTFFFFFAFAEKRKWKDFCYCLRFDITVKYRRVTTCSHKDRSWFLQMCHWVP